MNILWESNQKEFNTCNTFFLIDRIICSVPLYLPDQYLPSDNASFSPTFSHFVGAALDLGELVSCLQILYVCKV